MLEFRLKVNEKLDTIVQKQMEKENARAIKGQGSARTLGKQFSH